jgi:origin recognition complex subunit 1
MEDGSAAMRKGEGERKIVLNLETPEVERALIELGGDVWKNALGINRE